MSLFLAPSIILQLDRFQHEKGVPTVLGLRYENFKKETRFEPSLAGALPWIPSVSSPCIGLGQSKEIGWFTFSAFAARCLFAS